MAIEIYGASDDLIEIEGDIREEFTAYDEDDGTYLGFSDGTVIQITYDRDDVWRIKPIAYGRNGSESLVITQAPAGDEDNHSDVASLAADVDWVLHGKTIAQNKR